MGLVLHPASPWLEYCFYSYIFLMAIAPFAVSASVSAYCQTGKYKSSERKFASLFSPLAQEHFLVLPLIFSETSAQSRTMVWKQCHGESFLANDFFDFGPAT